MPAADVDENLVVEELVAALGKRRPGLGLHAVVARGSVLVHARGGGVDQPVAGLDGLDDAALALRSVGNLEDAEADDRHAHAFVQGDAVHDRAHPLG